MRFIPFLLLGAGLLGLRPASAQQLAQTLLLKEQEQPQAAVRLANRNTVVLLGQQKAVAERAVALRPDGSTAWETPLDYPQHRHSASVNQRGGTAVYTESNNVYALNWLWSDQMYRKPIPGPKELVVNHLAADGSRQLTRFALPERSTTLYRTILGHYAAGDTVYVVASEIDEARHQSLSYWLERYNLSNGQVQHEPLDLPPTPPNSSKSAYAFPHWTFLGHRPNQTYFLRRLEVHGPIDSSGVESQEFELLVLNNEGQRIGGFATHLNLPRGHYVLNNGGSWGT